MDSQISLKMQPRSEAQNPKSHSEDNEFKSKER